MSAPMPEWTFWSICSRHRQWTLGCDICQNGWWIADVETENDSILFRYDYVAWFRKHNDGKEPSPRQVATYGSALTSNNEKDGDEHSV